VFVKRLSSDRFQSKYGAIRIGLRSAFEATAKQLRNDCFEATAKQLRSDCGVITTRLRSYFAAISRRFGVFAKRLRCDCEAFRSDRE
jgi:hypothetical protein